MDKPDCKERQGKMFRNWVQKVEPFRKKSKVSFWPVITSLLHNGRKIPSLQVANH
jgi:hypothetical protein